MIILKVIGYFLLLVSSLILLTIAIPINYNIEGSKYDKFNLLCQISLYAGILQMKLNMNDLKHISVIISFFSYPFSREVDLNSVNKELRQQKHFNTDVHIEDNKINSRKAKPHKINNSRRRESLFSFINKEIIFQFFNLIKKIWYSIKPKILYVKLNYGFDDPYYTAMVCACISTFDSLLREYTVNLTPTFRESELEGEFKIKGRISIIVILYIIIRFMASYPIKNIIKKIIRRKKEEKRYAI